MTLGEVIARVDVLKPNAYSSVCKILWLSELEVMIQSQILLLSDADIVTYSAATSPSAQTVLGKDAAGLYTAYLVAMIDMYNGEFDRYNNSISLFNARFADYMRRHARNTDGGNTVVLSAYAIAQKHGFAGSEEEWLSSLRGDHTVYEAQSPLYLQDGVTYRLHDVGELFLICPIGDHSCHLFLETAASGTVSIAVEGARADDQAYAQAANGQTWEISVCNGCVISRRWEVTP